MNQSNKIIVATHCSNDFLYIDTFLERWKDADEIYFLVDNCTDGTYEKLLEESRNNKHLHVNYNRYTHFRFDLVRNDSFSFIKEKEGLFLFPCTDCWFIENNWRPILEEVGKNPKKVFWNYNRLSEFKGEWMLGIKTHNPCKEWGPFIKHPTFQETLWIFKGNLNNLFTVNPGGGEGLRIAEGDLETLGIDELNLDFFDLHLFHARPKIPSPSRWSSFSLAIPNLKNLIYLDSLEKLFPDGLESLGFLEGMFEGHANSFPCKDKVKRAIDILTKLRKEYLEKK